MGTFLYGPNCAYREGLRVFVCNLATTAFFYSAVLIYD